MPIPHYQPNTGDDDWFPSLVIPAGGTHSVELGEFEDERLIPRFVFESTPGEPSSITHTETRRVMPDGMIWLQLDFQNSGPVATTVRVREVVE
ncbi:hypothetical protein RM780_22405 [Streptomyces sp. DSM 44917]|uniref:Uncharacterized protein n=1 Tax=Streptomyces boetiae TaxID=3075541 RepID=A0ABU2LEK3_9ACTN|nr:hypothetical protein [Streptomyces sp. DSM 44917]MDT0309688.1 hypothetical protein [Streptomyces sp. DSM 44917]